MADRLLLESSPTDGYQLEDASGVLLLETSDPESPPYLRQDRRRPTRQKALNALITR